MTTSLLTLQNLQAKYGDALALHGVSLTVPVGGSTALLGRNGMGKTSSLRATMRMNNPSLTSGDIQFKGQTLIDSDTYRVSRGGIGYVPQGRHIFKSLTTYENLAVARSGLASGTASPWDADAVFTLFPSLADRRTSLGGNLSGGEQQMLAVGRALMTNPELLILDEPSEGLAPAIVDRLFDSLADLQRNGLSLLLAEQDLGLASRVCDHFVVLKHGRTVFEGSQETFMQDTDMRDQLLGLGSG